MHEQPVAIVTGAGSGIGRDAAILLAEAGYSLVLIGRTESKLRQTVELIRADASEAVAVEAIPADLTEETAPPRLVARTLERFGRIDALANVAGAAPLMPIDRITPEAWRACVDANLTSTILLTVAVWPTFRRQKRGTIVNVSSMASVDPFPGFAMYAAAKAGVNLFTRAVANEGRRLGVAAVAIAPGAVETPMLRANFNEKLIPADKALDPCTIAAVIRDCITGQRPFEPGETILMPSP